MSLLAGPASAIALVPQLRWWYNTELFGILNPDCKVDSLSPNGVSLYIPKDLFPSRVDKTSLPSFSCLNVSSAAASSCPYQGLGSIAHQASWNGSYNITINENRVIASDNIGWAWTTNGLLSALMTYGTLSDSSAPSAQQTTETRIHRGRLVPSPLVGAICRTGPSTDEVRELYQLSPTGVEIPLNQTFDLKEVWDKANLLNPSKTEVQWRDFSGQDGRDVLVGFILGWNRTQGLGNESVVSVCPVEAQWVPTTMYFAPLQSDNVLSNQTSTGRLRHFSDNFSTSHS